MMPDILVIGAGIAGLAAARQLNANFKVTVLEGRDRAGGRIQTDRSLDFPLDLGAGWIHGIQKNPIGKLAKRLQLHLIPTDYEEMRLYDRAGKPYKDKHLDKSWSQFKKVIKQTKKWGKKRDADLSIASGLEWILAKQDLSHRQRQLLDWWIASEIAIETGSELEDLSLWYWDEDEEFGGDDYIIADGYDRLIQHLATGVDIQFQQRVIAIHYNDRRVDVQTERAVFQADAVVVTLPLGVLKAGHCTFDPPLETSKQGAIARLAMGTLNKIVLQFPRVFWDEDCELIGYAPPVEPGWFEFLNLYPSLHRPVLVALVGGNCARTLESQSDRQVAETAMRVLRQSYGTSIPDPNATIVTRWNRDPFSLGAYSQIPVGGTMRDRNLLAKPVANRLFFAGEATSSPYPATVHGAFLSGVREAERIERLERIGG
jgi:monoamine oxidase